MVLLAESFKKAGIREASCKDVLAQHTEKERSQLAGKHHHLAAESNQVISMDRLQAATTAKKCMFAIKQLLIQFPDQTADLLKEIIPIIHERFKSEPGGKKLIGITLHVRDGYPGIKTEFKEEFFRRAFRMNGNNLEIKPGWRK